MEAEGEDKEAEGYRVDVAERKPLLQSTREMPTYRIKIGGREIGRVEDALFDDEAWTIRYLVVDCWSWSPGRSQLIPPECVKAVSRPELKILAEFRHNLAPTG
jgi:hypothetical protein